MALRHEHGKLRSAPPRRKDLGTYTAPEDPTSRTPSGQFAAGNTAAAGRALKALIRRQLGTEAPSAEVQAVYQDTLAMFRAALKELPASDAISVQDLVSRWARWSVLSARFAAKAADVGLYSDEGRKLLDMAAKLDARAERLQVTARDEAERINRSRPKGADELLPSWMQMPDPKPESNP